jgi:hypothetical protein
VPRTMTETERERFLAEPRVGVLSVAADGRPPLTVPVWYAYEPGGDLTFFTGTGGTQARKTRLLEEAGSFSLNVQHPEPPYRYVTVECAVVDADRAPTADAVAAITGRYLPVDMARGMAEAESAAADGRFVLFTGRPQRWLSTDFSD